MIVFKNIQYSNFLSTGNNAVSISLNEHQATLISGPNGSGKSTLLDALCFALFNRGFRSINKTQLINSTNKSKCLVELDFVINGVDYTVRRGMKPNIFEIIRDGAVLPQTSDSRQYQEMLEKQIVRMNFKTFIQLIVLGSAQWSAFMSLTPVDRRAVVANLLDLEVFNVMQNIVKEDYSNNKQKLTKLESDKQRLDAIISVYEQNKQKQEERAADDAEEVKMELMSLALEAKQLKIDGDALKTKMSELDEQISCYDEAYAEQERLLDRERNLKNSIGLVNRDIQHLQTMSGTCTTCKQNIPPEHVDDHLLDRRSELRKLQAELVYILSDQNANSKELAEVEPLRIARTEAENEFSGIQVLLGSKMAVLKRLRAFKQALETAPVEQIEPKEIEERKLIEKSITAAMQEREMLEISGGLLRDEGIKSKIIRSYVPHINNTIQTYLNRMGLSVQYRLDDTFTESICSPNRETYSYNSFSQGEKMRIDLALLFTFRDIARGRNSVATNLLIMDEMMDGPLDGEGSDEFLDIIFGLTGNQNVFIISHQTAKISDRFNHVIRTKKYRNFTKVTHG